MIKKITALFLACLFMAGSILLPLGDFSLIRDVPVMYRNYEKITTAEELGAIDFIGDYLLHGKEFFGHNEHDKAQNAANCVQFQHKANFLSVVLLIPHFHITEALELGRKYIVRNKLMITSNYRQRLFRPPLA